MAKTALILIAGLVSFVFSFDAKAFPVLPAAQVATSDVMKVRGFCGLGFHRGPYGGCVRNGVPYGYVAPVVVAPYVAPVVVAAPPMVCPFGYVYYPRYGRCLLAP
jgi:hypothetical protein